jgi:ElaB/YqjD/DUF883 family membrane-anchored ribosome-binding protein
METNFEQLEQAHALMARKRVVGDLRTLVRDSEDLLKATANDVTDKAQELRTRLADTLERAKTTCAELQNQTVASAKAAAKKADTVIRDHPYESIGIGFGLGLLIGVLVARK